MTEVNYTALDDQELKRYILSHRHDQAAFQAYLDRRHSRPRGSAIAPDDPDWEEKVKAVIQAQLNSRL